MSYSLPIPKVIHQKFPSQVIILYRGFTELINKKSIIEGKSIIQITWYPFPRITIKFIYHGEDKTSYDSDNIELKLTELIPQYRLPIYITGATYYGTGKNEIFGVLTEPFRKGQTEKLSSLVFHLSNFWWFNISNIFDFDVDEKGNKIEIHKEGWLGFDGQFIFDYDNWHIVLATLNNSFELQENLDAQGGYGITHICKIEYLDSTEFNLNEGYEIINAFVYYLSFVRGFWIAPILVSGFDAKGNQILEEWRTPEIKADSWQSVGYSWTTSDCTEIVSAFPGFMKKWQDPTWKEVIQNAIQWYIESLKHSNGYNTSIILIQAALEKLAWTYLSSNSCLSSNGFQKLTFDDKIRLFIQYLKVPVIILDENSELHKLSKNNNWKDSINVIGEVRNLIVHPKVNKNSVRIETSEVILHEVFELANSYLLRCLLKIFEYPFSIYEM